MIYDNLFLFQVILHPCVPTVRVYTDQIPHCVGYVLVNLFQGLQHSRPALESLILITGVRYVKKYLAKVLLCAMQFVTVKHLT